MNQNGTGIAVCIIFRMPFYIKREQGALVMKLKRGLYLGYYLKQLDREKYRLFLNYTSRKTGQSKPEIIADIISSVFRYNISILEYFQFRFFELSETERAKWAGTGYMYEFQLKMNPRKQRRILDDKTLFYKRYSDFFVHQVADIEDLEHKEGVAEKILSNPSGKLVFKEASGKCGAQVEIRACNNFNARNMVAYMKSHNYGLAEEFIIQHPKINEMSSAAVNTVRVITQLNDHGGVDVLGCRFRISVDAPVDNMAAGNLAAPIDETTGRVVGPGVYSDITRSEELYHPISHVKIDGFEIPYWDEILSMTQQAALVHPENRSIGWDVVVTEKGPGLIEGNHDWCKLLWQLPVKQGLKQWLKKYEAIAA